MTFSCRDDSGRMNLAFSRRALNVYYREGWARVPSALYCMLLVMLTGSATAFESVRVDSFMSTIRSS